MTGNESSVHHPALEHGEQPSPDRWARDAQGQRDRRAGQQQGSADELEEQVLDHVHAEQAALVRLDRRQQCDADGREPAEEEPGPICRLPVPRVCSVHASHRPQVGRPGRDDRDQRQAGRASIAGGRRGRPARVRRHHGQARRPASARRPSGTIRTAARRIGLILARNPWNRARAPCVNAAMKRILPGLFVVLIVLTACAASGGSSGEPPGSVSPPASAGAGRDRASDRRRGDPGGRLVRRVRSRSVHGHPPADLRPAR